MIASSIQNLRSKGLIKSPDEEEDDPAPQASNQPDPSLEDEAPSQQTMSSPPELAHDPSP